MRIGDEIKQISCQHCRTTIYPNMRFCPCCGSEIIRENNCKPVPIDSKSLYDFQFLGIIGSMLLVIGVFCPFALFIIDNKIIASENYLETIPDVAIRLAVLICSFIALSSYIFGAAKTAWILSILATVLFLCTSFLRVNHGTAIIRTYLEHVGVIQLGLGFWIMLIGFSLMIASPFVKKVYKDSAK